MENAYCDALQTAYEFEKRGEGIYRDAMSKVTNEFAKKVLQFLADEEIDHRDKIERFNASLLGKGQFDLEQECSVGVNQRIKDLIADRLKPEEEKLAPETTDLDVYDFAMDMEKAGYSTYEKALEDAKAMPDERLMTFFSFMLAEEKEHYELLAQSKRYLADSAYYFTDYGGWIFS